MQIAVSLEAQLRRAAGRSVVTLDVGDAASVADVVRQLADSAPEPLRSLLVDDAGALRPTLMVFLNDEHVPHSSDRRLDDKALLTITSPISGG